MKTDNLLKASLWLILWLLPLQVASAASKEAMMKQKNYEQEIDAIVRHKYFYKSGRVEWGFTGGGLPYDSLVNTVTVGLRSTWHISDHFGWEILDFQKAFSSVSGYTTDLVVSKTISRLETFGINMMAGTGLVVSPLYGKIRFIGRQVLYFDIYAVLGLGAANGQTTRLIYNSGTQSADQTPLSNQWNPMLNFGFGFKIFMSSAFGLVIDFRDYMIWAPIYDSSRLRHHFMAQAGLIFFTPFF